MHDFLTLQIPTYLGNKRSLLGFIGTAVDEVKQRLGKSKISSLDLFSGSGIVSRFLKQHSSLLISNDLENYAKILGECYLTNAGEVDMNELGKIVDNLNVRIKEFPVTDGFIRELYSPKDDKNITEGERAFYTNRNAIILDSACTMIGDCPEWSRPLLLGPLIYGASVHVNTSGVFKGFYKGRDGIGKFGGEGENALKRITGEIKVQKPVLSPVECEYIVRQQDARTVTDEVDFAYIDPPYNQHPYGSNYFMLNLVADYKRPEGISRVSGIPSDWNRSAYNKKATAGSELYGLLAGINAKYCLISYNSEGFVSMEEFMEMLGKLGKYWIYEQEYNVFRGCRNLRERDNKVTEYLFLLER